jgi:hypothetical protein
MYYKLSPSQEHYLVSQPETGMGYQILEASKQGNYTTERFLVLNSQIIIQLNGYESGYVNTVIQEGIETVKLGAELVTLTAISVLTALQLSNIVHHPKNETERGAIENLVGNPTGEEILVRLSAFDDDKRIDKINKCLRPGSFTANAEDYLRYKESEYNLNEHYALPDNYKIKYVFHIKPNTTDFIQRGIVQPANGKQGGGKEYFYCGTSPNINALKDRGKKIP